MKKYIKLEDGRVFEFEKCKSEIVALDSDRDGRCYYIKEYFSETVENPDFSRDRPYDPLTVTEWTEKFIKIISDAGYLHKFYSGGDHLKGMEIVLKYGTPIPSYLTYMDFDEDREVIVNEDMEEFEIEADEEVLLGSWYEGGMRFVAKWDREKKDWVLI